MSPADNPVPTARAAGRHHRKGIMEPLVLLVFLAG